MLIESLKQAYYTQDNGPLKRILSVKLTTITMQICKEKLNCYLQAPQSPSPSPQTHHLLAVIANLNTLFKSCIMQKLLLTFPAC